MAECGVSSHMDPALLDDGGDAGSGPGACPDAFLVVVDGEDLVFDQVGDVVGEAFPALGR